MINFITLPGEFNLQRKYSFTYILENLSIVGMQSRLWNSTVFNDAEELTKLSRNNLFLFAVKLIDPYELQD